MSMDANPNKPGQPKPNKKAAVSGPRLILGLTVAVIFFLAWAQLGVDDESKLCAIEWSWTALLWPGCAMQAHENLAGGLIAAAGALFAAWWASTVVREQIDQDREFRKEDEAKLLGRQYDELSKFYVWLHGRCERFFKGVEETNPLSSAAVLSDMFSTAELPESRVPDEAIHLSSKFVALRAIYETLKEGGIGNQTRSRLGGNAHFIFGRLLDETAEIESRLQAMENRLGELGHPPLRKTRHLVGERGDEPDGSG